MPDAFVKIATELDSLHANNAIGKVASVHVTPSVVTSYFGLSKRLKANTSCHKYFAKGCCANASLTTLVTGLLVRLVTNALGCGIRKSKSPLKYQFVAGLVVPFDRFHQSS